MNEAEIESLYKAEKISQADFRRWCVANGIPVEDITLQYYGRANANSLVCVANPNGTSPIVAS